MASFRIDLPNISPALLGIQVANTAEVYCYTIKANLGRQLSVVWIGGAGQSVGSGDKPVLVRIRDFTAGGSGATVITPVALDPSCTDPPRFTVNRYTTPPSAGELSPRYYFPQYPQSIQGHSFLHPQTNKPLVKLAAGRDYNVTVTAPNLTGGGFDYFLQLVIDED